jgi:succinate dehydrogenase/fumarate reductase flavoprotein subunit
VQGSNRLSSNSLTDVNVFGKIAGMEAASHARDRSAFAEWRVLEDAAEHALAQVHARAAPARGPALEGLHDRLKQTMFAHAGLVRDAASMARGIEAIAVLRGELAALAPVAGGELARYFELRNMIDVAEAVTRSALHRAESRGAHFRIDFPEKNDEHWRVATRVAGAPGELRVSERAVADSARGATA